MAQQSNLPSGLKPALIGNAIAACIGLVLLRHSPGEWVRPMDVPLYILGTAVATFVCAAPYALWAYIDGNADSKFRAIVAVLLCFTPVIVGMVSFLFVVWAMDLHLKP